MVGGKWAAARWVAVRLCGLGCGIECGVAAGLDAEAICERVLWSGHAVLGRMFALRTSGAVVTSGVREPRDQAATGPERTSLGKRWDARIEYSWPMPCGPMPKAFALGW